MYREAVVILEKAEMARTLYNLSDWDAMCNPAEEKLPHQMARGAFISELTSAAFKTPRAGDIYDRIRRDTPTDALRAAVRRKYMARYEQRAAIPDDLAAWSAKEYEASFDAWKRAKRSNDFSLFAPHLVKMTDVRRREIAAIDPNAEPFEVLVMQNDASGLTIAEIDEIMEELKRGLPPLLATVRPYSGSKSIDGMNAQFTPDEVRALVPRLLADMEYPPIKPIAEDLHPKALLIGPRDSRLGVSYEFGFYSGLYGGIHELGHACYQSCGNDDVVQNCLWGGLSGAFHEGQALFFEQMLGRDRHHMKRDYSIICAAKPAFEDYLTFEEYVSLLNAVAASEIRVSADELTYSLHIVIRWELERALFSGKIKPEQLREAWNDAYKRHLGIEPGSDTNGILQDPHWPAGLFGYFQNYALGLVFAAQLRAALLKQHPNSLKNMENGDYSQIYSWLREHVWQYGEMLPAQEILLRATGKKADAGYLIEYLTEKYGGEKQ